MAATWAVPTLVALGAVLALLVPFATHRTLLLWLSRRERRPRSERWEGPLPVVTVQLPVYNERGVVARLIDAACRLDYPRELLEVQVLDDSNDDTERIAAERTAYWQARGVRVEHVRRPDRRGFKAGALANGVAAAEGEFLLVLDADFVPEASLVRRLLPVFGDPEVGMVQARWDHLNEPENGLTRAQALLLDGHFFYEQGGRYASHRFFNFNGTAGMWRRTCLEEAGGWAADTLTEDLDLSYRAQMAGWRFEFLGDVGVAAELPASARALEIQQRRWAQGGVQTGRKHLPALLRGDWPWALKLEATIHLLGHVAHPLTLLLALLLFPAAAARRALDLERWIWVDAVVFGLATVPFLIFYLSAARRRGRPWGYSIGSVLRTLATGIGLSASVTIAVIKGLTGIEEPFRRTPKLGDGSRARYVASAPPLDQALKLFMAAWSCTSLLWAVVEGYWGSLPFLLLFAAGYLWLAMSGWLGPVRADDLMEKERVERNPYGEPHRSRLRPLSGSLEGVEAPVA